MGTCSEQRGAHAELTLRHLRHRRRPGYTGRAVSFYLDTIDFDQHNEECRRVWEAYRSRAPIRTPVTLGVNPRIVLLNHELNPERITFAAYSEDPDLMAQTQLSFQHYARHHLLQDAEMGLPADGWTVAVDLQNYYEAAWLGAPVEYRDGQVPDTRPILTDDRKRLLFDRGIPDPFTGGIMARNWQFYEHVKTRLSSYTHSGLPAISASPAGLGTDGPMTLACSLRGATELCLDFYEDPDYARELLGYVTEATIGRIRAFREALGHEMRPACWGFADDSIELLSVETYTEFVLPCHRRLLDELAGEGPHSVHLCGNVDRLMPVLKRELNLDAWDAGFPVDYARVRQSLGSEVQISTGPHVGLLLSGTPRDVDEECRRILTSGIAEGGRFILREANNLSPGTPVENVAAMFRAAGKYGTY